MFLVCSFTTNIFFVDNRQDLSKLCDSLVNMETTRDEILASSEARVDSTTPEKVKSGKRKSYSSAHQLKKAKIESAKDRAKSILSYPGYESVDDSDGVDKSDSDGVDKSDEVNQLRKQVLTLQKQLHQEQKKCKRNPFSKRL